MGRGKGRFKHERYNYLTATPEQVEAKRLKFAGRIKRSDERKRKAREAEALRLSPVAPRCACGCGQEAGVSDPIRRDNPSD